jgi:hypothetical protein
MRVLSTVVVVMTWEKWLLNKVRSRVRMSVTDKWFGAFNIGQELRQ